MFIPDSEFNLSSDFLDNYKGVQPNWGPLGYIVYKRTYALAKADGESEEWWETCKRVVEGVYRIQKGHCKHYNLPWSDSKGQASAQEMYSRMFAFKWLPPGRGLSKMGTDTVRRIGGACLNSCAMVSTKDISTDFAEPFTWLMSMCMVGVGVGFDTEGAGSVVITPAEDSAPHVVADSREGWCQYLGLLLNSMVGKNAYPVADYRLVRPKGAAIKGFGGTSSGSEALIDLTNRINDLTKLYNGKVVDSRFIVDVANSVGECVVSGGVRRTAEIAFGKPDDTIFSDLKNYESNPEATEWPRWVSNNSVIVNQDSNFEEIAKRIAKNGEPGCLFLENAQRFGRMKDPENNKDHRAIGANPCITGDTFIFTDKGPVMATELLGRPFTAVVDGKQYGSTAAGVFRTGHKPVYHLTTTEGHSVKVTADHKILRATVTRKKRHEEWVEARDLIPGDKIVVNNTRGCSWEGEGTSQEGWLLGYVLGDGHFPHCADTARMEFWGPEKDLLMHHALECVPADRKRSDMVGGLVEARDKLAFGSVYIKRLATKFGIDTETKDLDRNALLSTSSDFQEGFVRGFFDADGCVQGTQLKGVSVRLDSINLQHLRVVQQLLTNLGINSTLYTDRRAAGTYTVVTGDYHCHTHHTLSVSKDNLHEFSERVGFVSESKTGLLNELLENYARKPNRERFVATFEGLQYLRNEDVYDCTIEGVHRFGADNLVVHNCNEQTLENWELCCLVETFPSQCTSYEDYEKTLKYAYLYAKTVTLVPTQSQKTNAVMLRNRRIGCSQSGIQDNIIKVGLRTHLEWCDRGYKYINHLDDVYSGWLCVPTSIKMTSIKPSGSVSKLPGVREGIHESKGEYEMQSMRLNSASNLIPRLLDAGYRVEDAIKEKNTVVVYFPMYYPRNRQNTATMWEQLEMAALMQEYWADNQVSVTVDFDPETEGQDIARALTMYAHRLKGVSFLPRYDHGYLQPPKEVITKEAYEEYKSQLKPLDFTNLNNTHDTEDRFCDGGLCTIGSST